MKKFNIKNIKNKSYLYYLIILIVALIMCAPLFQEGIHTGHDGDFHISRTIGTIEELQNGNSPFIVSRFSNNLGFGWNLFYPPINTALNVIFAFLTGDVVIAIKVFIFFTFAVSGISMFTIVKKIFKSNTAALISSIIYMIAPYRLLNAYTRLAVGEMTSFMFIPIIFNGVYEILKGNTRKSYLFTLGAIGLILSHNISTMLVCILGFFYVLINIKKLKDKKILKAFIISTIIIVLSVIFFEIPLLQQQNGCDYEVFRYGKMYSTESVPGHALNPLQLILRHVESGADTSMYFCLGIPILIGLILTFFIKKEKKDNKNYWFFFISGIIATIMSTVIFPWKYMPSVLLMIQFPWRMLEIVVFCFAIISGINYSLFINKIYYLLKEKFNNITNKVLIYFPLSMKILFIILFIILSLIYSFSFITDLDYEYKNNDFYRQEEIIDPVGEVSRYSSFLEYWPQKAVRNLEYISNRDQKVLILSGTATIENENKEKGKLDFDISNVGNDVKLELPYLFYTGYTVTYTPENSKFSMKLEVVESDKGLVQVNLTGNEKGHIHVEYQPTKSHIICMIISFTTLTVYIIYLIFSYIFNKCNKKLLDGK